MNKTNNNPFFQLMKKRTIVFDGAMGTMIQKCNLHAHDFGGEALEGANDHLVITRPDVIEGIYKEYLEAGADVIETNSFGSNRLKLEEYNLTTVREHNIAAAKTARKMTDLFSTTESPRFVFGSMGPTGMLPSSTDEALSAITFDQLYEIFNEQSFHLIEGGVHGLLIETSQDILEVKAAVVACHDARLRAVKEGIISSVDDIVIQAQVTLDPTGRMLLGTDIKAALAILEPLPVDVIGLNCSTGPNEMRESVRYLLENSSKYISAIPNAGMPINEHGHAVYKMDPDFFAKEVFSFISEFGLHVTGGCCGTTPAHIKALKDTILAHPEVKPREVATKRLPMAASAMTAASLVQIPAPTLIGERLNSQGSRKMKDLLIADDLNAMLGIARTQEEGGAHVLDICLASNERTDEAETMQKLVKLLSNSVASPLMIDSTEANVIETALKSLPGRPIVNSVNLEGDGKTRIHSIMPLVKKFGTAVVALTIDEKGMADTVEWKLDVAKRIHNIIVNEYGLLPQDILFDCLTFTLATGEEKYNKSAIETLNAIKKVKEELPGVLTTLGLSNVSFGFSPHARKILNSVFLYHAVQYGLDTAILNPNEIVPFSQLTKEDVKICEDLLFYKHPSASSDFINYFENKKPVKGTSKEDTKSLLKKMEPKERVHFQIVNRISDNIEESLAEILKKTNAVDTINNILLPAMKDVGEKFGAGELILPFVLQSAEVMKKAVAYVEQFLDKADSTSKGVVVLATVYGDVHDIGKNLVKTILSNNGYTVIDLGKQVPVAKIIEAAVENKAMAVGLSALLVSTSKQMTICVEEMSRAKLNFPVIVGGAAINRKYSYQISFPQDAYYEPGVFYAKDAFEGLTILNTLITKERNAFAASVKNEAIEHHKAADIKAHSNTVISSGSKKNHLNDAIIPKAPFYGRKILTDISFKEVFDLIDQQYLFRFKWGIRSKGDEFYKQIKEIYKPKLYELAEEAEKNKWIDLKLVYGFFKAKSKDNQINVLDENENLLETLSFPRQIDDEQLCLSDYVSNKVSDNFAMTAVTAGQVASKIIQELQDKGELEKSYLFAGLSTQMAEGLAEYIHKKIRNEWGIDEKQGLRYSFGYPACPDLQDQEKLYRLLKPQDIGLGLTEAWQMDPEQSTSALVFHHPQCSYYKI
ncbi:MAG: methionine synthase [Spirochaetia bacterium]|nr:methionine synthase [Spirochaetia bacterium]